jgi:hypothetical protein
MKVQYVEHVPPDVAAAKFWLLNRRRAQWSDTSRHELTGANGGDIEISQRSELDRARRIAYILSQAAATKVELEVPVEASDSQDISEMRMPQRKTGQREG